jgi:hypothetical protein
MVRQAHHALVSDSAHCVFILSLSKDDIWNYTEAL